MFFPYTTIFFLAFIFLVGACVLEGRLARILCWLAFGGVWGISVALAFNRHDLKIAFLPPLCFPLYFLLSEIKRMF